jgi:bacillolysin
MRTALALMLLGFSLSLAACGGGSSPSSNGQANEALTAAQTEALHALELRSKSIWSVRTHETLGTPAHVSGTLRGALSSQGRSLESASLDATVRFLDENRALFRMHAPASEFRLARARTDALAMTHVRLQQTVRGIRVLGGELMAHYAQDGSLRVVDANYVAGLDALNVNPSLTATQAESAAVTHTAQLGAGSATAKGSETELVVFKPENAEPRLAYTTLIREDSAKRMTRQVVIVDAQTGAILNSYDNLQTIEVSATNSLNASVKIEVSQEGGRYVMKDAVHGGGVWTYSAQYQDTPDSLPGQMISTTNMNSWDQVQSGRGAAVDAHLYAGNVYDYYKTAHARLGINGSNARMVSSVHFGQNYPNAFWNGDQMGYGDGDQGVPFSASLDVVGHEFSHGVTSNESNLAYQGQSGALNEAFSDIMGCAIEHQVKPSATNNWIMGEDLGFVVRNMATPKVAQQPDHMSAFVRTSQDNGGVHINSGIINNAAYLMTMGGTNSTSRQTVERGIGWEKMAKVFYRANAQYLMASSTFAAMATAAQSAANDLGLTANEKKIVVCAFRVVGVESGTCDPLDPETPAPSADAGTPPKADAGASEPTPGTPTSGAPDDGNQDQPAANGELQFAEPSDGCSTSSHSPAFPVSGGIMLALVSLLRNRKRRG